MAAPARSSQPVRLLLDEMHASSIAETLRSEGFDVVAVSERPDLRGTSDADLFALATSTSTVIITENIRDFAPLAAQRVAAGRPFPGLVFTNPKRFNRAAVAYPGDLLAALRDWLAAPPPAGDSWTWWL